MKKTILLMLLALLGISANASVISVGKYFIKAAEAGFPSPFNDNKSTTDNPAQVYNRYTLLNVNYDESARKYTFKYLPNTTFGTYSSSVSSKTQYASGAYSDQMQFTSSPYTLSFNIFKNYADPTKYTLGAYNTDADVRGYLSVDANGFLVADGKMNATGRTSDANYKVAPGFDIVFEDGANATLHYEGKELQLVNGYMKFVDGEPTSENKVYIYEGSQGAFRISQSLGLAVNLSTSSTGSSNPKLTNVDIAAGGFTAGQYIRAYVSQSTYRPYVTFSYAEGGEFPEGFTYEPATSSKAAAIKISPEVAAGTYTFTATTPYSTTYKVESATVTVTVFDGVPEVKWAVNGEILSENEYTTQWNRGDEFSLNTVLNGEIMNNVSASYKSSTIPQNPGSTSETQIVWNKTSYWGFNPNYIGEEYISQVTINPVYSSSTSNATTGYVGFTPNTAEMLTINIEKAGIFGNPATDGVEFVDGEIVYGIPANGAVSSLMTATVTSESDPSMTITNTISSASYMANVKMTGITDCGIYNLHIEANVSDSYSSVPLAYRVEDGFKDKTVQFMVYPSAEGLSFCVAGEDIPVSLTSTSASWMGPQATLADYENVKVTLGTSGVDFYYRTTSSAASAPMRLQSVDEATAGYTLYTEDAGINMTDGENTVNGLEFILAKNGAYSPARSVEISADTTTGVENIAIESDTEVEIYNLRGIRVHTGTRGAATGLRGVHIVRTADGNTSKVIF